jgi:hypothetical protein
MHRLSWVAALGLAITRPSLAQNSVSVEKVATKYVPGVAWQRRSIVSGNFSCHGRKEQAILGVSASEIVIAVFVNGLDVRQNDSPALLSLPTISNSRQNDEEAENRKHGWGIFSDSCHCG